MFKKINFCQETLEVSLVMTSILVQYE